MPTKPTSGFVLVVEDEPANRKLVERLLKADGFAVRSVADGEAALALLEHTSPDLILLDVQMPGIGGFEVCRRVKSRAETRLTPVIFITGLRAREDRIEGIDAGADDFLTKPFDRAELRARVHSLLRVKRYTDELDSAESVIMSLALTVEARDPYTEGHCERLAAYATALGAELGLTADDLAALHRGGYLHDLGKIGIPDSVLHKPARLTPDEFDLMKQHPVIGERLCGSMRALARVRSIVRHHHERLDGTGYPDGLSGADVPMLAQIVAVADVFDAITTTRPYRAAQSPDVAYQQLTVEADSGAFSKDLVHPFIELGRAGRLEECVPRPKAARASLVDATAQRSAAS